MIKLSANVTYKILVEVETPSKIIVFLPLIYLIHGVGGFISDEYDDRKKK